jgi:hypothetical protein
LVSVSDRSKKLDIRNYLQVDDADVVEAGKEAEAEERRWNKRSQQMLVVPK